MQGPTSRNLGWTDGTTADVRVVTQYRDGPAFLRRLVDEVVTAEQRIKQLNIDVTIDVPADLQLICGAQAMHQAVAHLVDNAVDAMPTGGELVITSYHGADGIELEVADSGPGLPEATRHLLFEPQFTTKKNKRGMGLSEVKKIVERLGGHVSALNCPEGGAAFTLHFPSSKALSAAA